ARLHSANPATRGSDERSDDPIAETRPQRRAQISDAIRKTELGCLAAGPVFAGEQGLFGTLEPRSAAALDQRDELLVDFLLQRLEAVDVLRILRKERIEHGLVLAGNIKPALYSEFVHQLGKAEGTPDDSDRADDRGGIAEDLVGGASDHVAAGGSAASSLWHGGRQCIARAGDQLPQMLGTVFVGHRVFGSLSTYPPPRSVYRRGAMSRLRCRRPHLKLGSAISRRGRRIKFRSAAALFPRAAPIGLGR